MPSSRFCRGQCALCFFFFLFSEVVVVVIISGPFSANRLGGRRAEAKRRHSQITSSLISHPPLPGHQSTRWHEDGKKIQVALGRCGEGPALRQLLAISTSPDSPEKRSPVVLASGLLFLIMGGANMEIVKFAFYLAVPISMMGYFGNTVFYKDSVFPSRGRFWPEDKQVRPCYSCRPIP